MIQNNAAGMGHASADYNRAKNRGHPCLLASVSLWLPHSLSLGPKSRSTQPIPPL